MIDNDLKSNIINIFDYKNIEENVRRLCCPCGSDKFILNVILSEKTRKDLTAVCPKCFSIMHGDIDFERED